MPANTSKGYPYPLDLDPLADIALAVKNLADQINDRLPRRVQTGTAVVTPAGTQLRVNFPTAFANVPIVTVTLYGTNNPAGRIFAVVATTTTYFDVVCYNGSTASVGQLNWIAVGQ